MRALLRHLYNGVQVASVVIVLGTLAPRAFEHANGPVGPPPAPVVDVTLPVPPAEPMAPPEPMETSTLAQAPAPVQPEFPPRVEREKVTVGFNVPEGSFDFNLSPGALNEKPLFDKRPQAPADPAPVVHAPPVLYRYGYGGRRPRLAILRNPAANPANPFGDKRKAGPPTGGPQAFDDRPERNLATFTGLDPLFVRQNWKRDVEEFRRLSAQGVQDQTLQDKFGDRYSSVKWASNSNASLKTLPEPTDSYAAALKREQGQRQRH